MASLREKGHQLKSDFGNVRRTLGLAAALPKYLREPVMLQQAEEGVKRLLDTRTERFLELIRTQVYESPGSPYLRLLEHAGCGFSDLRTQVLRQGLEITLAKLAGEGVYLTSDEFKGKTEVVRGGKSFHVSPEDFAGRNSSAGFATQSSGSRNRPVNSFNSLEWHFLITLGFAIFCSAHDLYSYTHAVYEPVIAGRMAFVLYNAKLGIPVDRWFALEVPVHSAAENKYHYLNARLVAKMGRWFGPGIANPEYLDLGDVEPILEWIAGKQGEGKNCCIKTVVSNAVRIARGALEKGVSLEGTRFRASGEPLTPFKQQLIKIAGARISPSYGPGGGNGSALGCGNPRFIDEVHIPESIFTLVEHPEPLDEFGSPIHPLMVTTLHRSAPRLLLNVENGDYATMITRDCGCLLQKVGFKKHVHTIRSFEKMTGEGTNYSGTELFELLEHALPLEFGGESGDYQLVEEEDPNGQTRLTLLVHPELGDLNEEKLLFRLRQGLARGSRNHRFMTGVWQEAGTLRIKHEVPYASPRGKILPLHIK